MIHGTSEKVAEIIKQHGWKPSHKEHLLGEGIYFVEKQDIEKAMRFAHDVAMRFQDPGAVPVIVFTTTTVGNVKWVNWDYKTWEEEQFDACRARKTSMSKTP